MKNFLFLDTNARATIIQIREIKMHFKEKCSIHVISLSKESIAKYSRFIDKYNYAKEYNYDLILNYIKKNNINFIMISDEKTIHLFNKEKIYGLLKKEKVLCSIYSYHLFKKASDKYSILKAAKQVGLLYPRSRILNLNWNKIKLKEVTKGLSFPIVLKPITSIQNNIKTEVEYAKDFESFYEKFIQFKKAKQKFMIQEYIEGMGFGYESIINNKHEIIAHFAHKRLRELHLKGGGGVLCESYNLPNEVMSKCQLLLKKINFIGPSMIELKQDKNGNFYLIEINARFWGSIPLAIASGVNFPVIWINELMGIKQRKVLDYKHKYYRWLLGDLNNLMEIMIGKVDGLGKKKSKLTGIYNFIWCPKKDIVYFNPVKSDFKCFYGEIISQLTKKK